MLISISEKCRMNCPHCMDDAKPVGNDMDEATFKKAFEFGLNLNDVSFTITGGEPMDHPDFWNFLDIVLNMASPKVSKNHPIIIAVTTNGMAISECKTDDIFKKVKYLENHYNMKKDNLAVVFQVSAVEGLYPIKIDESNKVFKLSNVIYDKNIIGFYPQGRAKTNNLDSKDYENVIDHTYKCSHCFNIRSIVRNTISLEDTIMTLRLLGKMCTPSIKWNGDIALGESTLCPSIGNINDDIKSITKAIIDFRCNRCDMNKMYSDLQLEAIGEK